MIRRLSLIIMLALTFWVIAVATAIEFQNAAAEHYLPRRDNSADGTWRTSMLGNEPRDRLYHLIVPAGLCQYLLAPILAGLAVFHFATNKGSLLIAPYHPLLWLRPAGHWDSHFTEDTMGALAGNLLRPNEGTSADGGRRVLFAFVARCR